MDDDRNLVFVCMSYDYNTLLVVACLFEVIFHACEVLAKTRQATTCLVTSTVTLSTPAAAAAAVHVFTTLPLHHFLARRTPRPAPARTTQAFVTLGGIATSVVAALREVTSTDAATDWTGLAAGFAAGLWLGWSVSPLYELQLVEANADDSNTSSSNGTSGSSRNLQSSTSSPPLRVLLPVLRDTRPAVARANAVFGYAGLLFAVLGAWLLQQGGL